MERREFLRGGAAAGALGLTGLAAYHEFTDRPSGDRRAVESTGGPGDREGVTRATSDDTTDTQDDPTPPDEVRHGDEYGTVVDVVKAGADPDGKEPIDDVLAKYADDDTLLSVPPGTYLLPAIELAGFDHLGVAAAQDERPTFVAPASTCGDSAPHVKFATVTDFLLEGVDFDFRRRGAGGAINVIAAGDATVRGVTAQGSCRGQVAMFRVDIRDSAGTGLVEDLRLRNVQDRGWMTGVFVGKHHSGEVTFRDCRLSEFTDNGLYASAPGTPDGGRGTVHTVGGHFENNNVSNVRLGTAGSSARGDTIVVESSPGAKSVNLRGIRFRRGADQVVEDCELRFGPAVTNSFGAVVFHPDSGTARVADTRITMHSDAVPAVKAFYYSGDGGGGPVFENLTIDGDASRGYAVQVNGRDGTTFRNCTVEQPGDRRDGIRMAYADDCELVDSRIDVTGYPLILRETTMTIRNTTFVTPDGERHVDEMEAEPGDFRPGTWQ